jgi:HPt (histidine-containing phosphotransfer) domain-containing protein
MDDYLTKPIRVEELIQALTKSKPDAAPTATSPTSDTPSQTSPASDQSLLNPKALQNLRDMGGGDPEFLTDLIDSFLRNAPRMLADLRQALANQDAANLRLHAHSLKSNSNDFGATELAELSRQLEMLGKAGSCEGAGELLGRAELAYQRVKVALEEAKHG